MYAMRCAIFLLGGFVIGIFWNLIVVDPKSNQEPDPPQEVGAPGPQIDAREESPSQQPPISSMVQRLLRDPTLRSHTEELLQIQGRVDAPDGKPLSGASVVISASADRRPSRRHELRDFMGSMQEVVKAHEAEKNRVVRLTTTAKGSFLASQLVPGYYKVVVSKPGFAFDYGLHRSRRHGSIRAGGAIQVTSTWNTQVRCNVQFENETSPPTAVVSYEGKAEGVHDWSPGQGSFSVEPGRYFLRATAPGGGVSDPIELVVNPGDLVANATLTIRQLGALFVRCLASDADELWVYWLACDEDHIQPEYFQKYGERRSMIESESGNYEARFALRSRGLTGSAWAQGRSGSMPQR